jgi:hypothetical protein
VAPVIDTTNFVTQGHLALGDVRMSEVKVGQPKLCLVRWTEPNATGATFAVVYGDRPQHAQVQTTSIVPTGVPPSALVRRT